MASIILSRRKTTTIWFVFSWAMAILLASSNAGDDPSIQISAPATGLLCISECGSCPSICSPPPPSTGQQSPPPVRHSPPPPKAFSSSISPPSSNSPNVPSSPSTTHGGYSTPYYYFYSNAPTLVVNGFFQLPMLMFFAFVVVFLLSLW